MSAKYIIVDNGMTIFPVVFPDLMEHSEMFNSLKSNNPNMEVYYGGFVDFTENGAEPYGSSKGLEVECGPNDKKTLDRFILK